MDDLIERLRDLAAQIDPLLIGGRDAQLLLAGADRIAALEADKARLMGLLKEAAEALSFVADRAAKLKAGTDDWFELVEFEQVCRPVLAKLQEPIHDDQ